MPGMVGRATWWRTTGLARVLELNVSRRLPLTISLSLSHTHNGLNPGRNPFFSLPSSDVPVDMGNWNMATPCRGMSVAEIRHRLAQSWHRLALCIFGISTDVVPALLVCQDARVRSREHPAALQKLLALPCPALQLDWTMSSHDHCTLSPISPEGATGQGFWIDG